MNFKTVIVFGIIHLNRVKITEPGLCWPLETNFRLDDIVQDYLTYYYSGRQNPMVPHPSGIHALCKAKDFKLCFYNKDNRFYFSD